MSTRKRMVLLGIVLLVCGGAFVGLAQQTTVPAPIQQTATTAIDQVLTFIDSASTYLGQGVVYLLNLITNDRVSDDLRKPIGYLAFITLILLFFGLLEFARKIIWIGIVVGWVLLVVRVVLDALNL